jgi:predicted metal-binding membrane protein
VLGYLAVWTGFALVATIGQTALGHAAQLDPRAALISRIGAGALLIAAGLYQVTPWKQACLRHCRSPMSFVITHWRGGRIGALRMGVLHGAFCLGCCWCLMLLLFFGGVMNLWWIVGLTVFVIVEKSLPGDIWIERTSAAVLVGWGVLTLVTAA